MMAIEAALPAGPIDEGNKNQHSEIPVAHRPIEQPKELPNQSTSEGPDQIHLRTSREVDVRGLGCYLMVVAMPASAQDDELQEALWRLGQARTNVSNKRISGPHAQKKLPPSDSNRRARQNRGARWYFTMPSRQKVRRAISD